MCLLLHMRHKKVDIMTLEAAEEREAGSMVACAPDHTWFIQCTGLWLSCC